MLHIAFMTLLAVRIVQRVAPSPRSAGRLCRQLFVAAFALAVWSIAASFTSHYAGLTPGSTGVRSDLVYYLPISRSMWVITSAFLSALASVLVLVFALTCQCLQRDHTWMPIALFAAASTGLAVVCVFWLDAWPTV